MDGPYRSATDSEAKDLCRGRFSHETTQSLSWTCESGFGEAAGHEFASMLDPAVSFAYNGYRPPGAELSGALGHCHGAPEEDDDDDDDDESHSTVLLERIQRWSLMDALRTNTIIVAGARQQPVL